MLRGSVGFSSQDWSTTEMKKFQVQLLKSARGSISARAIDEHTKHMRVASLAARCSVPYISERLIHVQHDSLTIRSTPTDVSAGTIVHDNYVG